MTKKEGQVVFVKKSKNGRGIFAKKDISNNELILELKGSLITCYEDDVIDEQTRSNTIRFNSEKFLNPKGKLGELINHSCNPNSKLIKKNKKLYIVAITPISKNTEIVFDYSTVLANDDIWQMKCNCKTIKCRKIIKKFNSLPRKTKEDYTKFGIVPKYILSIK